MVLPERLKATQLLLPCSWAKTQSSMARSRRVAQPKRSSQGKKRPAGTGLSCSSSKRASTLRCNTRAGSAALTTGCT
ncbi:hypothetical protein FQZ97_1093260 [compost metagenome]